MDVTLVQLNETHIDGLARLANNKNIADNVRDMFPHPYATEDAREYIALVNEAGEETQCVRAILIDGEVAGCVGFFIQRDVQRLSAELGYWLGEPFWGRGAATLAVREMCGIAFGRYGLIRVFATPFGFNPASCRVLEKAGFTREGVLKSAAVKNGRVTDLVVYALINGNNEAGRV